MSAPLPGPILVIGAGLLGTSVALALSRTGHRVVLSDLDDDAVRTARALGAGGKFAQEDPRLVVVATSPDAVGRTIVESLERHLGAVVTDVGSVKAAPLAAALSTVHAHRYVGGHPMAGSERSGALAASAMLFEGRPWAICAHDQAAADTVAVVRELALDCGAVIVEMDALAHDLAVARTSHLPYLMSVLMAAQLESAPSAQLSLSGPGVRDVTRIAGSDPTLWTQIVESNAAAIAPLLRAVQTTLGDVLRAVEGADRNALGEVFLQGVAGTERIPGKHGGPAMALASVYVAVPDQPGELARLFADVGLIGTNIEDMRIDHDTDRAFGLTELLVGADQAASLTEALESRGWVAHR